MAVHVLCRAAGSRRFTSEGFEEAWKFDKSSHDARLIVPAGVSETSAEQVERAGAQKRGPTLPAAVLDFLPCPPYDATATLAFDFDENGAFLGVTLLSIEPSETRLMAVPIADARPLDRPLLSDLGLMRHAWRSPVSVAVFVGTAVPSPWRVLPDGSHLDSFPPD